MESCGQSNGCVGSYCHALTTDSVQVCDGFGENEDLAEGMLKEFDSYWEDIDVRLTISRMVSDSVIRGMVNAVEQEAAFKIAQKDLELERLKGTLHLYHVCSYENDSLESLRNGSERNIADDMFCSSSSDAIIQYEKTLLSLGKLKSDTLRQLNDLREEIDLVREGKSARRMISSGSELVGLGDTPQEGISKKCTNIDVILYSLSSSLGCVFKQVDDIARLSKTLFSGWELESQYQEEIESMVIKNCIHGVQEQFERWLRGQMQFRHIGKTNITYKVKEISSFRQELDAISNSLSNTEAGQLMFHGSTEFGDKLRQNNITDHLHHLGSGNHASLSASHLEANGNMDPPKIMNLNKEGLVQHFKAEMATMKLDHDFEIGRLTEELFNLRAKYLKERDQTRSLPPQKDKEFDVLRNKIPDVIKRLDEILLEYAKLPAIDNKDDSLDCLKERIGSLLSENLQLRDSLEQKKKQVDLLFSQLSDAAQKMSQHSLTEANLVLMKENLETAITDARIEASIGEDVWKCVFNDVIHDAKCTIDEFAEGVNALKEINKITSGDVDGSLKFRDVWLESVSEKELVEIIFKEALGQAYMNLNNVSQDLYDKDRSLHLEIMEKEVLTQEMLLLKASIEDKETLLQEAVMAFEREKMHHELASKELEDLQFQRNRDQILLQECNQESNDLKHKLFDAFEKVKLQEAEKIEINGKFDQALKELSSNSEEKRTLLADLQEKDCSLSAAESRENASREQMESAVAFLQGLLHQVAKFRKQVVDNFKRTDQRLLCLKSELNDIGQKANILNKTKAECKQRLELKTSDLDKAETEVDLLGDEVDALLSLLEKIYIALDHYSPVLRHYPGIVEILKLVRRELGGETATRHGRSLQKSNIL